VGRISIVSVRLPPGWDAYAIKQALGRSRHHGDAPQRRWSTVQSTFMLTRKAARDRRGKKKG